MASAANEFWTQSSEYTELAKNFYRGIEHTHPETVTSRQLCHCLDWTKDCPWAATKVTYYQYNGESV